MLKKLLSKRETASRFKIAAALMLFSAGAVGCGLESGKTGSNEQQLSADQCGSLVSGTELLAGDPLGLVGVGSDGHAVVGETKLDCSKPIAVFVHGWSLNGNPYLFASVDKWKNKGYQTLSFFWHDLSSDPSFENVFTKKSKTAADRLTAALRDLYAKLGQNEYNQEIRLIGHSFGAKLAIEATARVAPPFPLAGTAFNSGTIASRFVPISRLTLLDPAIFTSWGASEVAACPILRVRMQKMGLGTPVIADEVNRMRSALSVIPSSLPVEIYATNVASAFSFELANAYRVQTLSKASFLSCFIEIPGLTETEIHNSVIDGYLGSIDSSAPVNASGTSLWSAATKTSSMGRKTGWYVLESDNSQEAWGSHIYRKNEIPANFARVSLNGDCEFEDERRNCDARVEYNWTR